MRTPLVLRASLARLRSVLLVVRVTADFPQVGLHGLFAVGQVALCEERSLVGIDLHEVFCAQAYCVAYLGEARTDSQLLGGRLGRARVAVRVKGIETLTVRVSGCSLAVNGYEVVAVVVSVLLFGALERSGDGFDAGRADFDFCHSRSAITRPLSL